MTSKISISDNTAAHRYEALVEGALAGLCEYRLEGSTLAFTHTEVLPAFEGQGVGSAIARHVLDDARARGLSVLAPCKFIAAYIERHPAYADLLKA